MTLEQTTGLIAEAADAQDFEALRAASQLRAEAIAALNDVPPSAALYQAIGDSLEAGEQAKRALQDIKRRVRNESRRLANLENGFVRALREQAEYDR